MRIPIEDRDTYEDKLRRQGYGEEAIMLMSFTRMLMIEEQKQEKKEREDGREHN